MKISRQCRGTVKATGLRCKRPALMGQRVCYRHGGNSQQALRAARMRMLAAVEPAIMRMLQVLADDNAAYSDWNMAARFIADRGGLAAGVDISAVIEHRVPGWENVISKMFREAPAIEAGPSIVEAEVVPSLQDLTDAYEQRGYATREMRRAHAAQALGRDVDSATDLASWEIQQLLAALRPVETVEAEVLEDPNRYEATPGPGSRRLTDEEPLKSHSENGYPRLPSSRGRSTNKARLRR